MSETIKAILTADSADLQAELTKAASAVQAWEAKVSRGKVQLPTLELSPQNVKQMENAAFRAQALGRNMAQLQSSGKNGALGLLAISQAAEDAQYGLKGVLNNIPQAVLGLGGSAGLAGALSLAAVAGYTAWNAFQRLSGIDAVEKWAKGSAAATEEFTAALEKNRQVTERIQQANQDAGARDFQAFNVTNTIASQLGPNANFQADLRRRAEAAARERARQDAIARGVGNTAVSGEGFRAQAGREWESAAAKATQDRARATEDLAIAQENLNKLGREWERINASFITITDPLQAQKSTATADAETLRQSIASKQAELDRNKKLIESLPNPSTDRNRFLNRNASLEKQIADEKAISEEKRKQAALADELIQKALQQANATKAALDSQSEATRAQRDAARETLRNLEDIEAARAKTIQFDALRGQNSTLKENLDTATQQREAAGTFADELQIAAATLELGKKKGEELAKEIALRKQAVELAKNTGMSEERALADVRALAAAKEKAEKQPTGSIAERARARAEEREKKRQDQRDEAVQEAARNREERKRAREGSKLDPKKDEPIDLQKEADRIRKEQADKERKAREDLNKNIEKQTKLQEEIREMLKKVSAA